MDDILFNRRKRMLTLLGARNKPSSVFKVVAEEFKVPVDVIRKDYQRMKKWTHAITQEEQATAIALECMEFGVRQAVDLLLSIQPEKPGEQLTIKQGFLKVAAINAYTKAIVEENHFKQTLGVISRKPEEIITRDVKDLEALIQFSREAKDSGEAEQAVEQEADDEQ